MVDVLIVVGLEASYLGLNLVLHKEWVGVDVSIQELVSRVQVWLDVSMSLVQGVTCLTVGVGQWVEDTLDRVLESRFIQLLALVSEQVRGIDGEERG